MMKIALTGSIGMGKSTVAAMFERAGIPVFDADAAVRRLQGKQGALLGPLEERFPGVVVNDVLDRDALARRVIDDPAALAALEAIVHPAVREERERFIEDHHNAPTLLFDIPLLFETAGEREFDKVIVVSAPPEVQRQRMLQRAGMTPTKFHALLSRQMPDAEKRSRADFVIDTSGDLSTTEAQVDSIITCLGLAPSR